jgi:hypothetical protein
MRFVAGTGYAARSLTGCIVGHATNPVTSEVSSSEWDGLVQSRTDA